MLQIFAHADVKNRIEQNAHPLGTELVFPHRIKEIEGGDPDDARNDMTVSLVVGGEVRLVHRTAKMLRIYQRRDRSVVIKAM